MAVAISPGMGVTLSINDGAVKAIGEILSIGGPTYSTTAIETTHLGLATGEQFRTFMTGMHDAGELSVEMQLDADDAGQAAIFVELETDAGSVLREFILTLNDAGTANATSWTFNGIITAFDVSGIDIDGRVTASMTVKISGEPTYAAAADV